VRAYGSREFPRYCLQNAKFSEYRPVFTTQDEWTIVMYVMEGLRPFRYWTLLMSMRHSVRLHHVITVYNDMFNHKDGIMGAFPKQKTPWKQDSYCAVKLAWQKLSKYYAKGTPTTGMHVVSADIIDPFRRLRSFRMWEKGMDINPEDVTSYTTQYQERSQKYVQNEYCAKHRHVPVIKPKRIPSNNLCPCATASGSSQCSNDPYHLSRDDEECLIHNKVAKTTPRRSDCSAC